MQSHPRRITFHLLVLMLILVLFLILSFTLFITRRENKKQLTQNSTVLAGDCTGNPDTDMDQGCTNGGNLLNGCNWICNSAPPGTDLSIPSCCNILASTGNPGACCFDARRRCTPQQCNSIPEGVPKQRCGQLWELGYCSPIFNPTNPPQPTSPPPTQPPLATRTPTPRPTRTPTPRPTSPFPTNTPPLYPTNTPTAPTPTSTFISPSPTSGQFIIPTSPQQITQPPSEIPIIDPIAVMNNLVVQPIAQSANKITEIINTQAPKALDFFEFIFERVTYYDFLLEQNINDRLRKLFNR